MTTQRVQSEVEMDDNNVETTPDTTPDAELLDALTWLKKAGIVSAERPAFAGFFDELVLSKV